MPGREELLRAQEEGLGQGAGGGGSPRGAAGPVGLGIAVTRMKAGAEGQEDWQTVSSDEGRLATAERGSGRDG